MKNLKIKLIYVPRIYPAKINIMRDFGYSSKPPFIPPYGISLLSSYLKSLGFKVKKDDLDIKAYVAGKKDEMKIFNKKEKIIKFLKTLKDDELEETGEKILKMTKIKGFDFFGLSIVDDMNFSAIASAIILAKLIKEKTDAYVCLGGILTSRPFPEVELIKLPFIDFVVTGNHFAAADLLFSIENEKIPSHNLEEVICREDSIKRFKKINAPINKIPLLSRNWRINRSIEEIRPIPDFSDLPMDLYKFEIPENRLGVAKKILVLPYSFSFGCLNGCAFCPNSVFNVCKYKQPQKVVEEIFSLKRKFKTKFFLFLNDNFNPSYNYALNLARSFIKEDLNIYWLDCINLRFLDKNLISILKESGGVEFIFGLESGSQKILNLVEKKIVLQKAKELIKFSYLQGVWNIVDLIVGLPHEREEDVKKTIKVVKELSPFVGWFQVSRFMLLKSKFLLYPEKYRICNIRDNVNSIADERIFPRKFDEKNGLKWKEKRKQINTFYKKILNVIKGKQEIQPQYIFYLNDILDREKYNISELLLILKEEVG
ncbi:MAG: radical SAM protein [Candidatus Aenigmatarchaeota archaeon]